ncbi:MAG TPA: hypothetical protein VIV60_34395 [Polyangiaceae bacterium]
MIKLSNLSLALTASLLALVYACSDDGGSNDENIGGSAGASVGGRAQGGQNAAAGGSTLRGGTGGGTARGGAGGSSNVGAAGTSIAAGGAMSAAGSNAVITGGTATSGSTNAPAAGQSNVSGAAGSLVHSGGSSGQAGSNVSGAGRYNSGGSAGSAVAGAKATLAGAAGSAAAAGSTASQPGAAGASTAGTSNAGAAGNGWQEDPRCSAASPEETLTAHLRITADNECDVYVNGQSVGQTTNWGSAVTIDVSLFVHPGRKNVVAVVGRNTSSQGGNDRGIIGELTTTVGATTTPLLVTDAQWRVAHALEANFSELDFDDSSWPAATEIASNGDGPWGNVLGAGSTAKWIWFAPVPTSTSDKPNAEATYARRVFYFDFAGQLSGSPLCYAP